jgi:hypothetical protein
VACGPPLAPFLEERPMETRIDARAACDEVAGVAEAIAALSPGDVVCQGDRYITCVEAEPPGGVPAGTRQLAPGTSRGAPLCRGG